MSTYIQLVNKVLRRLNEVEIPLSQFDNVRGIHAVIKDAVIDTISRINQEKYKWPFHAVQQTQVMTIGVDEYAWPTNFQSVDWQSFQIQKDDTLKVDYKYLMPVEREQWYSRQRDRDYGSLPKGFGIPDYVFSTHGNGFGISPMPNAAFTIKYRYFKNPIIPVLAGDEISIPEQFEYVIISGALYHAYVFLDNNERSQIAMADRDKGIKEMTIALIGNNFQHMYDGRVRF